MFKIKIRGVIVFLALAGALPLGHASFQPLDPEVAAPKNFEEATAAFIELARRAHPRYHDTYIDYIEDIDVKNDGIYFQFRVYENDPVVELVCPFSSMEEPSVKTSFLGPHVSLNKDHSFAYYFRLQDSASEFAHVLSVLKHSRPQ